MGLSRIFNISTRSLSAYQQAMDVTAHNVANAGNPNYSRQRVLLKSEDPQMDNRFSWGMGIKVEDVSRIHDNLIEAQIVENNQKYSANKKESELLQQIETVFGEPTEYGLSNYLSKFFDSWSSLSASPNSIEARKEVVFAAENLSNKISDIYQQFANIKTTIANNFKEKTTQINDLLKQIKDLNFQIYNASVHNQNANDLADTRDKLINDLSSIVDVKVSYNDNNVATVYIGGVFAVNAQSMNRFKMVRSDKELGLRTEKGNVKAFITKGEMFALSDVYSNKITHYEDSMNTIFQKLVDEVNTIHQKGYTINQPPQTNIKFFNSFENGTLTINPEVEYDPKKIAVSSDGTSGNGDYAVEIADLKEKKILNGMSLTQNYAELVDEVGNNVNNAKQATESTNLVLQQLQNEKDSYSGVSIDEEMTKLLKFQKSYDASAKLIKIANEVLDTLINIV